VVDWLGYNAPEGKMYPERMPDNGTNPHIIPENDPLLNKLLEVHSERRYQSLELKSKLKQTGELK
jgi:hypothetical protein